MAKRLNGSNCVFRCEDFHRGLCVRCWGPDPPTKRETLHGGGVGLRKFSAVAMRMVGHHSSRPTIADLLLKASRALHF